MNALTKLFFNPIFAPQFKNPKGIPGALVSKVMRDNNFFVYPGIERHADFRDGQRVLEIGYGPGTGIEYFLSKYALEIDGIDVSRLMYREASKRNRRAIARGSLRLYHGVFETYPCGDNAYDRIIFANVVYFWDDLNAVFGKIRASLKPGGILAFYMSDKTALDKNPVADNPVFIKYTVKDVCAVLERARFSDVRANGIVDGANGYVVISAAKAQ
jgi:SAM-dependent methyltransferase